MDKETPYMVRKIVEFPDISMQCSVKFIAETQKPLLTVHIHNYIKDILSRELELYGHFNYEKSMYAELTGEPLIMLTPKFTGNLGISEWSKLDNKIIELDGSFSFSLKRSERQPAFMKYVIDVKCIEGVGIAQDYF